MPIFPSSSCLLHSRHGEVSDENYTEHVCELPLQPIAETSRFPHPPLVANRIKLGGVFISIAGLVRNGC